MHPPRVFRIEFGPLNVNINVTVKVETDAAALQQLDEARQGLHDKTEGLKEALASQPPS